MTKIILTGSSGLIGSKFVDLYQDRYDIVPLTSQTDITDQAAVEAEFNRHPDASIVIHLAAYTNVTGAFEQTDDKTGPAWRINVDGTRHIAQSCQARGWRLIQMSTAYVFDGDKETPYVETDAPKPIEWYGRTKAEAEQIIDKICTNYLILRIDQPFSSTRSRKVDTLWRIIDGLQAGTLYPQFTNHTFGPTYIENLTHILDFAIRQKLTGIYHASSGEAWTDYDFATAVRDTLHLTGDVKPGDLNNYLATLNRPYQRNTALDTSKLSQILDFKPLTIREAIAATQIKQ